MIKFIKKTFFLFLIICVTYIFLGYLANGTTDPFYLRFTTPKQQSLILGTSRAAQGIVPEILNKNISKDKFEGNLYNFSFTILHSPYGEIYYKAIENKLDKNTKKGLYILAVDPWSLSARTDLSYFREAKLELGNLTMFNSFPNYDYLLNAYQNSFFNILKERIFNRKVFLHHDGWLEVAIKIDSTILKNGGKEKLKHYRENSLPFSKISKSRLMYLEKTISLLKNYGKVLLVRIPVDDRMLVIENELDSIFNLRINSIAKKHKIPFLIYKDIGYVFPDANHLHRDSGKRFSKELAKDINKIVFQ